MTAARRAPAVSDEFKRALVAGPVAGGGLTVIANAPNPAGFSILKDSFEDGSISPLGLFAAALAPTAIAIACLWGLEVRGPVAEVFDVESWTAWFSGLDRSFFFLLILPFVVVAVGFWAESLRKGAAVRLPRRQDAKITGSLRDRKA